MKQRDLRNSGRRLLGPTQLPINKNEILSSVGAIDLAYNVSGDFIEPVIQKYQKCILNFHVTRGDFRMKFKNETSTLIFSAKNALMKMKHMALEFTECGLLI